MLLRYIFPASAFLLAAWAVAPARACDAGYAAPQVDTQAMCSPYMTPNECQAHRHILAYLTETRQRNAYLAMYTMLIEERQALCRAAADRRTVGLLTYRHP